MKLLKFMLVLFIATGFLAFEIKADESSTVASGKDPISFPLPNEITFEGKIYRNEIMAQAFLDSALSAFIRAPQIPDKIMSSFGESKVSCLLEMFSEFNRAGAKPYISKERRASLLGPERLKKEYPWLAEYLLREEGIPPYFVINKWVKDIKISTGFPLDMEPFEPYQAAQIINEQKIIHPEEIEQYKKSLRDPFRERPVNPSIFKKLRKINGYTTLSAAISKTITSELSILLPEISALTGQTVTYLPHEEETKDNLANIRIVFVSGTTDLKHGEWKTRFKRGTFYQESISMLADAPIPFESVERHLYTAVEFTPHSSEQVFGYFLPNKKNEIELAVCYIWQGHEESLLRALIRECVIRSLGLPNSHFITPGILSLWNDPGRWTSWQPQHLYFTTRELPEGSFENPPDLGDMDKFFIRLLYHPEIKPGMGYSQVLRKLTGF